MIRPAALAALIALSTVACSGPAAGSAEVPPTATAGDPSPPDASVTRSGDPTGSAVARALPGAPGPVRGLPRNAIHLQPAVIIDATGFEQPMAATTLFLPYGWRTQGGVFWGMEAMCTNGYVFNWSASSPDGRVSIAVLPQDRWETNNYGGAVSTPGCRQAPFTSVRQYLEWLARQVRPGATVLGYRPRQDLQQEFAQLNSRTPTAIGEMRTWVEAGQVYIGYNERGVDMRGLIAAVAVFNLQRSNVGTGQMDALTGATFPVWFASAPNGWLNEPFFEGLRRSMKGDPQWQRRINGHNAAIGRVALEESRKRSQMIMESSAEISRIRQSAWQSSQESADRRAAQFGELMRGVQTFDDPNAPGGQAQLSNLYSQAWRLNDGSYVLSNEAGFDPWRDLQLQGQKLELTQR